jgi:uncharacterized damage-inducible protein DinB
MNEAEFKAQVDALAAFPEQLKRQLESLSDAALRFRPAPDGWSIVEIVGHMTDVDAVWPGRVRQMLSADNPRLQSVDNDVVRQRDYQNKQIGFMLITLAERRAEFVELLRVLRPEQLARPGLHPTRGPITVGDAPAALADHDRGHREQIAANLAAFERGGR